MMETYKARHAIRDVGAALGFPPAEVDQIAKAFPHIRAKDVRGALERAFQADGPNVVVVQTRLAMWAPSHLGEAPEV